MKIYSSLLLTILIMLFISIKGNAQWVQTNGPNGGRVNCFAIHGKNLYAGTSEGDIYRSADNGTNWNAINNGLTSGVVYSLAVSGSNLYAGVDTQVFISSDSGKSWKLIRSGTENSRIFSILVSDSNLFIGIYSSGPNDRGVYRSTDNGTSWIEVNTGFTSKRVQAFAISNEHIFAGTMDGIFLSTNNGSSWNSVNSNLIATDIRAIAVIDTNIYVGAQGGGVFHSTDYGNSWQGINFGLDVPFVSSLVVIGTDIFAGTNRGIYLTTDNGTLWNSVDNGGLINKDVIALISNGEYLFAGTYGDSVWRRPLSEMINTNSVQPSPTPNISSTAYPNPFTTSTTISYTLPERNMVTIEVFDILGRKIQKLANEVMDAGPHRVVFHGENLPLGMYTVKITSGASSEEMKVVLSK